MMPGGTGGGGMDEGSGEAQDLPLHLLLAAGCCCPHERQQQLLHRADYEQLRIDVAALAAKCQARTAEAECSSSKAALAAKVGVG